MAHVIKPRIKNGVVETPERIVITDNGYARGFEPETIDALYRKAKDAGKGLAEYCRDVLAEHAG